MAINFYWVGGSGNWSNLSHWATSSGGTVLHTQIPTGADDVFFDANSFTAAGQSVNLDQAVIFTHDLNWTGVSNTPAITGAASTTLKIYGSLKFVTGMIMNFNGDVDFQSPDPGQIIDMAGKSFNKYVNFNVADGEWTLQNALTTTSRINLNNGTLNTNGQVVNALEFYATASSPGILNMSTSIFNISGNAACWNVSGTGITLNCGSSVINCTGNNVTFYGSGKTYYNLNGTTAGTEVAILDNNTFNDIVFSGKGTLAVSNSIHNVTFNGDGSLQANNNFNDLTLTGGHYYVFHGGTTQTINGAFNANGNCKAFIDLHSDIEFLQATISHPAGPVTTSYLLLKDMAVGDLINFTADNSIDFGDNTNWLTTGPVPHTMYWIGNSGNWNDPAHWSLSSGGAPAGCVPNPADDVRFDANSFTVPGQTVSINVYAAFFKDMNWTGVTNSPTLDGPIDNLLKIYGSLTFSPGMNLNFQGDAYFGSLFSETVTSAGKVFKRNVEFNSLVGFWTLQDALSVATRITVTRGTLTTNDQTVNATEIYSSPGGFCTLNMGASVFNLSGNQFCWRFLGTGTTVNCGTSVINCSGIAPEVRGANQVLYDINFTNASAGAVGTLLTYNKAHDVNFAAAGLFYFACQYHNVTINGDAIFQNSNIFNDLTFATGHSYLFWNGKTQTVNGTFSANGICPGTYIDMHTDVAGAPAFISHPPGTVTGTHLMLKDIVAMGGANFIAYSSNDLGGNTGWNFTNFPPLPDPGVITGTSIVCQGSTGVTYSIAAVAGANYYFWSLPAGAVITNGQGTTQITVDFNAAVNGNITVFPYNNCTSSVNSASLPVTTTMPVNTSVNITANPTGPICSGTPVLFTANTQTNSSGTFTYNFKVNGLSVQNGASNNYTAAALLDGDIVTCYISVTGGNCYSATNAISNTITMLVNPKINSSLTITAATNNICVGTPVNFTAVPVNPGNFTTYQWQLNGNNVGSNNINYANSNLANGDKVSCIMTTITPCLVSQTVTSNNISMVVNPQPVISFYPGSATILSGESIQLNAYATGNINAYLWTPATGLSNTGIPNPVARPGTKTTYHLKVTGAGNCSADSSVIIDVLTGIYIPNSFVPGGVNNIFGIPPRSAIRSLEYFIIYNRYGNLVFITNNINTGWDGTFKQRPCDAGVYTYIIKARDNFGEVQLKGTVNLIR